MAQSSVGFAGTVLDADWAAMAHMLGTKYCVDDPASLAATQVAASRNVSIAAGSAFGRGVKTTLSAPEAVTIAAPVAGQWYLVVLRRTWATKVTALVALPSTTTTATLPDLTTATVPTTATGLTNTPGTIDDQPIVWVWVRNTDTTQLLVDARRIWGQAAPRVSSVAHRAVMYPAPVIGDAVYHTDTRELKRYTGTLWAGVRTAAFTSTVSLGNGAAGTMGTFTADAASTTDANLATLQPAGVMRILEPGVYLIDQTITLPAVSTGITRLGLTDAQGNVHRTGSSNDAILSMASIVVITAANTDLVTYALQTTGATRTVTGRLTVTKLEA